MQTTLALTSHSPPYGAPGSKIVSGLNLYRFLDLIAITRVFLGRVTTVFQHEFSELKSSWKLMPL